MKNYFKILLALFLIFEALSVRSQVASPYQVATWSGFRSCAITYTFDDGFNNQFVKAIPMFDEFDFKLTLYIVTGWNPNYSKLQSAVNSGHEVGNHTATHANFGSLSTEKQEEEINVASNLLNSKITGQQTLTMAYPYCARGNDSLHSSHFIAARACQGSIEPANPKNFINISSIVCGTEGSIKTAADYNAKANQAASSKGWLVYLLHGLDNEGGYSPVESETLRASLEYLKENDQKFWVNSFVNVAKYIKQRNCISVSEVSSTETTISVMVSDTLDNEVFDFPITISRPLPEGWEWAVATQNSENVRSKIIVNGTNKTIQFDAIPDGGTVVLTKSDPVGSLQKSTIDQNNQKLKAWSDSNHLYFAIPEKSLPNPEMEIYTLNGALIKQIRSICINNQTGIIPIADLNFTNKIYLLKLNDSEKSWTTKFSMNNL
jgi:peptidoglycan-N-acetylglucosamine deacetylase